MENDSEQGGGLRMEPPPLAEPLEVGARGRGRRRRILWLLVPLTVISLYLVLFVDAVGGVRNDLLDARSAMERGRDELLAGDAQSAAAWFEKGEALFDDAEHAAGGPLLRPVGWLPVVGRTIDAVGIIAGSGATAAQAADVLAEAVADLPGGPDALAPHDGRIPVERIPPLARAAAVADALMRGAAERVGSAPDSLLIGPVAEARRDAQEQLEELRDTIHTATGLLGSLPAFLGSDGPRTYFFGAQNPAELRGTGGLIGAYALLTIDDGRLRFSPFSSIYRLPASPLSELPAPNEDFAENYNQFRGAGRFWSAINVMPDLPSVAEAILTAYEAGTGERLDGVILADPFALRALLDVSGPVELPGYGTQIDASNVVPFTTNEAYSLLTDSSARKRILGEVARAAFERFMVSSADLDDLERLTEAAAERHILVYSTDPDMEQALQATPAGGTLVPGGGDANLVSVVVNSAAGSKVDFYQQRTVTHAIALREDGSASASTEVVLHNGAPSSGQPPYVIGPFKLVDEPGESIALVHVYCGVDCIPGEARLDGTAVDANTRIDLGVPYFQHYYHIPSKGSASFEVSWEDPDAWEGNSSGGTYRMTFANQVSVQAAHVTIRIEPPPGMSVVSASDPLDVVDGVAVYEGTPGARLDLEVEFAPPLPTRLWRNVVRFLTTPVIDL